MYLKDLFKTKSPVVGFEIFPPRPETPLEGIYKHLGQFSNLQPDYISVTYGAGGGHKQRTVEIASKIKHDYSIESMGHLTCTGQSLEEIDSMLDKMEAYGLENILALRGDPPAGEQHFYRKGVFDHAFQLIEYIKKRGTFCISAAAYVEGHPDCSRMSRDFYYLKEKVAAGVDFLVTQMFFDNRLFYDFVEKCSTAGINCPVTAGIMPVFKAEQIKTFTAKSGCSIPGRLVVLMDKYSDNPDDMLKAGIEYAAGQIRDLLDNGAAGIHLYTMNRPKSSSRILAEAGSALCPLTV